MTTSNDQSLECFNEKLPDAVVQRILWFMDLTDFMHLVSVNRQWQQLVTSPKVICQLFQRTYHPTEALYYALLRYPKFDLELAKEFSKRRNVIPRYALQLLKRSQCETSSVSRKRARSGDTELDDVDTLKIFRKYPIDKDAYQYLMTQGYCRFVTGFGSFKWSLDVKGDDVSQLIHLLDQLSYDSEDLTTREIEDLMWDVHYLCIQFHVPCGLLLHYMIPNRLVRAIYDIWDQGNLTRKELVIERVLERGIYINHPWFYQQGRDAWLDLLHRRTRDHEVDIRQEEDSEQFVEWFINDAVSFAEFLTAHGYRMRDVELIRRWIQTTVFFGNVNLVELLVLKLRKMLPNPGYCVSVGYAEWLHEYGPNVLTSLYNALFTEDVGRSISNRTRICLHRVIHYHYGCEMARSLLWHWIIGTPSDAETSFDWIQPRLQSDERFRQFFFGLFSNVLLATEARDLARLCFAQYLSRFPHYLPLYVTPHQFRAAFSEEEMQNFKQIARENVYQELIQALLSKVPSRTNMVFNMLQHFRQTYHAKLSHTIVNNSFTQVQFKKAELVVSTDEGDVRAIAKHKRNLERLNRCLRVLSDVFVEDFGNSAQMLYNANHSEPCISVDIAKTWLFEQIEP